MSAMTTTWHHVYFCWRVPSPYTLGKKLTRQPYFDNAHKSGTQHIYTRNESTEECDQSRFCANQCVPIYSSSYSPLRYLLLYFAGETGWFPGDFRRSHSKPDRTLPTKRKNVGPLYYAIRQRLLIEPAVPHTIFRCSRTGAWSIG